MLSEFLIRFLTQTHLGLSSLPVCYVGIKGLPWIYGKKNKVHEFEFRT